MPRLSLFLFVGHAGVLDTITAAGTAPAAITTVVIVFLMVILQEEAPPLSETWEVPCGQRTGQSVDLSEGWRPLQSSARIVAPGRGRA